MEAIKTKPLMEKQTAKTKVFTQDSLTELQEKMHIRADQDMEAHPEIFEGESLKDIEKGRNSDWSKEFYIRQKAETLEELNIMLESVSTTVSATENTISELNKQAETTIQKLVDTEAQKEFMRYAFLQEPKTAIGKLVSGAWKQFKSWWDEHKRPQVEESTRDSVRSRLADFKKQVEESKKAKSTPTKRKGIDR